MFAPVALRMKFCSVLILAGLSLVACSGSHSSGCDFRTSSGYSTMPLRDGYSKLIMKAKEADGYLQQSLRVLCNPCLSDKVEIEWEIRNASEESIEVYSVNQPRNFLDRGRLSSSSYFDVEDSEENEVKYEYPMLEAHFDTSDLPGDARCFSKEYRDVHFIPLKPGESFVFRTNLATTYRFEPGEYRVRYRGPFRRRWNTKWVEFKVVE